MPPLARQKLTKRVVDGLKPDALRDVTMMDAELRGFGVRLKPSGSGAYFIRYKAPDGSERRFVLGKVGVLTPDEARKLATENLAAVAKGADPSENRREARAAMTVAEISDWYLGAASAGDILGRRGQRIKASTLTMDKSRIETHIKPLIGRKSADALTDSDIARLQRDIATGKTVHERQGLGGPIVGGKGVAARSVRMLGAIFEHAKRAGFLKKNPCRGVRQFADGVSNRRLSEDELKALGIALRAAEASGENLTALAAVRFLAMTGFRRMEALSLRWDTLDARTRTIALTDSKSGAQVRIVGGAAISTLDQIAGKGETGWVFPAYRGVGHFVGLPKVLDRLFQASGIEGASIHTLRHTFASVAADEGFSELTVAALLGHARRGVTQRYAKIDRAAALAADAVAGRIAGLLDGRFDSADVLPLHRAS